MERASELYTRVSGREIVKEIVPDTESAGKSPVLETPRLLLREMDVGDLDFIASLLADPEVMRFFPKTYSREEAAAWVRRQQERYARDGYGYWLALEKATGAPVGQAGLIALEVDGAPELGIGYIIGGSYWRRGLATEAAAACRDHAFARLGKARVITLIRPENAPSLGVAAKLDMRPEKRTMFAGFEHLVLVATRQGV